MSETPVLLTALVERLKKCQGMIGNMCSEGRPPKMRIPAEAQDEDCFIVDTCGAMIDLLEGRGHFVCIEAERLARMEAALRKIADAPNAKFDLDSVSKDFASGMLKAFGAAATIARAAIPEQPASQSPNVEYVLVEDMVEGSHPQYGRGLFTTYNCVKTGIAREALAAQEVGNG